MNTIQVATLSRRARPLFPPGTCWRDQTLRTAGGRVVLAVVLTAGCSSRAPLVQPSYSPTEAAHQAIAQYDKNGDGVLDATELDQCPALKSALKELDKNNRGKVTEEAIASRLEKFQQTHVALEAIGCRVKLDGSPLEGAQVTFLPEAFMGPSFKPARGVSDDQGAVRLVTEGQEAPGVAFGYYRVEVSKTDAGGRETLPARYNAKTILGREVAPTGRGGGIIRLELTGS